MSEVVSVRVPKELKEKMKRYNIDWSREIKGFIEEKVRTLELLEIIDEIEVRAEKRRTKIDSTRLIRESRYEH